MLAVKVASSFGTLVVSAGLILNIAALSFILETGYNSLRELAKPLQEKLLIEGSERKIIKNVIKEIEEIKPLTGNGFFEITRGSLTGMVSVGITYIIILVQFKISAS